MVGNEGDLWSNPELSLKVLYLQGKGGDRGIDPDLSFKVL